MAIAVIAIVSPIDIVPPDDAVLMELIATACDPTIMITDHPELSLHPQGC
jgi:hypothetical protein